MIIELIGVTMAVAAFAILLETPKKYIGLTAITGAVGGGSYLLGLELGVNITFVYFMSAVMVTIISNIFAKVFKTPVTVFLIAGILPTVPGAGVYQVAYNVILGNQELSIYYFIETVKFAGAISLGIFVIETIWRGIVREYIYRKA